MNQGFTTLIIFLSKYLDDYSNKDNQKTSLGNIDSLARKFESLDNSFSILIGAIYDDFPVMVRHYCLSL